MSEIEPFNYLQRIIIISYLEPYNYIQTICIRLEYLISHNSAN